MGVNIVSGLYTLFQHSILVMACSVCKATIFYMRTVMPPRGKLRQRTLLLICGLKKYVGLCSVILVKFHSFWSIT